MNPVVVFPTLNNRSALKQARRLARAYDSVPPYARTSRPSCKRHSGIDQGLKAACGKLLRDVSLALYSPSILPRRRNRGLADDSRFKADSGVDGGRCRDGEHRAQICSVFTLFKDRPLVIFLICAVLFHFANAAMLPLLGEMLSKGHGRSSMMFMSACVVTTQIVVTFLASWSGIKAQQWGRKPLLLIAFGVLPIRGILYTMTNRASSLIAIQVLDGVGAAIFGVVSVLVIADLTRGTGRFNLTSGAVTTAVGTGAALSQTIAGGIVHRFGYHWGFLFLAAVAAVALSLLWLAMPETRDIVDRSS